MCLFAIVASFVPRLGLALLWIFTPWVGQAFDSVIWPILGLLFFPLTAILYILLWTPEGISGIGIFFIALAFLADLGSMGGSAYGNRSRY